MSWRWSASFCAYISQSRGSPWVDRSLAWFLLKTKFLINVRHGVTSLMPKALHRCITRCRALAVVWMWQLKGIEKLWRYRIKWQITSVKIIRSSESELCCLLGLCSAKISHAGCSSRNLGTTADQDFGTWSAGNYLQGFELLKVEDGLRSLGSHLCSQQQNP